MKKAIISRVTRGRNKGQFKFTLKGANGETVAVSHPETYTRKAKAVKALEALFEGWAIVDTTVPQRKTNVIL